MAGTLASLFVELGWKDAGLKAGIKDSRTDFKKMGSDFKKVGLGFSKVFTLPAIAAGGALLKIGSDHDAMVDTIRIGTGLTGDALKQMDQDALGVFANIPTSMDLVGTAFADLNTRTGQTGAGLMNLAQAELELARITGGDLAAQIASTTRLFGDWGIGIEQQVPTLDMLFRASQATGIGVDELASKMVQFGAPLRQMGFEFEETSALLGKFEKEGVNTELVMGSLRIALGKMAREGINDPKEALGLLVDQIKNAGSVGEANAIAFETFGARAGPDMAAAIREGRFDLGELFDIVSNGTETIQSAALETNDWRENLQILQNRIATKLIPVADRLFALLNEKGIPFLTKVSEKVESVVMWFNTLPRPVKIAAAAFGALLVAIGPVLIIIGTLIGAIGPAIPIIAALLGAISLPLLVVIGLIALFAVAWAKNWGDIRGKTKALIGFIWGTIQPFVTKFMKATQTIRTGLRMIVDAFKKGGIKGALGAIFGDAGQIILKGLGRILGLPTRIIGQFLREIKTGFAPLDAILHNIGAMFQDVGLIIQAIFSGQWGKAFDLAWDLLKRFLNQYRLIGELLLGIFKAIPWTTIGSALWDGFVTAVSFLITTGAPWLYDESLKLLGNLLTAFTDLWESDIKPWLTGLAAQVFGFIASDDTFKMLYNAGNFLIDALSKGISFGWDWLIGWFKSIPDWLTAPFSGIFNAFWNIGYSIISGMSAGIQYLWNTLVGWIDSILGQFNRIPDWLKPGSPSKTMTKLGQQLGEGLTLGIAQSMPGIKSAIGEVNATLGMTGGSSIPAMPAVAGAGGPGAVAGRAGGTRILNIHPGAIVVKDSSNPERTARVILRAIGHVEVGAV